MARIERDREDLLAEATAMVQRAELALPGQQEPVIVGFRANGCASVYFGPDEAYQFNTAGELRRAYRGSDMYKAQRGRLVRLRRRRTGAEVQLLSHELDAAESAAFLGRMEDLLRGLADALGEKSYRFIGEVPEGADVIGKAAAWLKTLRPGAIARTPHAR